MTGVRGPIEDDGKDKRHEERERTPWKSRCIEGTRQEGTGVSGFCLDMSFLETEVVRVGKHNVSIFVLLNEPKTQIL